MSRPAFSIAQLRRAWDDPSLTVPDIARKMGASVRTVSRVAHSIGLPRKPTRNRRAVLAMEIVKPLWTAGLSVEDMALILGVSHYAVQSFCYRNGMRRGRPWFPSMTRAEWLDAKAAEKMRADPATKRRLAPKGADAHRKAA